MAHLEGCDHYTSLRLLQRAPLFETNGQKLGEKKDENATQLNAWIHTKVKQEGFSCQTGQMIPIIANMMYLITLLCPDKDSP